MLAVKVVVVVAVHDCTISLPVAEASDVCELVGRHLQDRVTIGILKLGEVKDRLDLLVCSSLQSLRRHVRDLVVVVVEEKVVVGGKKKK